MPPDNRSSIGVRVRPNAHDFIRDLNQQLRTKKYTFYVDVGAKTGQATRDVRAWAQSDLKKVNAVVNVRANTGPATRDVAQWRAKQRGIETVVPVSANMAPANREVELWRQAAGRDLEIRVKADISGRGVEAMRRQLGRTAEIKVRADTSEVKKDIQDAVGQEGLFDIEFSGRKARAKVREFFEDIRGEQLELDLGVDTTKAEAQVEGVKKKAKQKVKTQYELDMEQAQRELLALRIQEKARALNIGVDIDQTDLAGMRLQLARFRVMEQAKKINLEVDVQRSGMERAKRAMDQLQKQWGSFTVIRSLDLGPLNLGKPTGLLGTVSTLTVLAGLVPGVVTGVTALSNALVSMAGAAAIVPGAIGGILASLSTFSVATKGVSDAFGALFELWDEGPTEQASAARRSVQAQNQYRNAIVDEAKAQRQVGEARRSALSELRNLNNELRGGVLNEAQAILDLQKARDRLAQGGFENQTEYLQAQLDERKALLNIDEVRERNLQTQQKANDAQAKGVEGSDEVVAALEGVTRAQQQAAEAMEAMNSVQATGAMGKFSDELAQLSPNAQAFILTIAGMRGPLLDLRNQLQDTFFSGLDLNVSRVFENLMPIIGPGMNEIAAGMNQNMLQVFESLDSPSGQSIIERILGGTAEAQQAMTGVIDPLIRGVGTLTAAGAEHLPQVVELIGSLAERFAVFIEEADRTGKLDEFLDRGVKALGQIAEIGINAIKIVNDLDNAFGGDLLQTIVELTTKLHEFLSSPEGQQKMKDFITEGKALWEEWKPVLKELPALFSVLSEAAANVLGFMLPLVKDILGFLNKFPGAIEAIATALFVSKLLGSFSTLASTIGGIVVALGGLPGLINRIPGVNIPGVPAPGTPDGKPKPGGKPGIGGGFIATHPGLTAAATAAVAVPALVDVASSAASQQPGQSEIDTVNAGLPKDTKPIAGFNKDQSMLKAMQSLADKGDPVAKWVMSAAGPQGINTPGAVGDNWMMVDPKAELELAKRYAWAMKNPDKTKPDSFTPPTSYAVGGFTPWGEAVGKLVELHGKEFVQPADTTAHYGVGAMEAIRQKRVPKELLSSFQGGGYFDPNTGQWIPSPGSQPNPGLSNGIIPTLVQGATQGIGTGLDFVGRATQGAVASAPGTPHGLGGTPGPAPGTTVAPTTPFAGGTPAPLMTLNMFGFELPIGQAPQDPTRGWGPGGPPPGLGGGAATASGEAPFDIRKHGIGPGPMGSGPADWLTFAGGTLGEFGAGLVTTFASGVLDFFGLGGILNSPYANAAKGLVGHFAGSGQKQSAQGPGAAQTSADVTGLLNTADAMAANPAYPGIPALPMVIDPATGTAVPGGSTALTTPINPAGAGNGGLQINTLKGKQVIQQNFPWATNIGGVRRDNLKWHPMGLALDVMTDPGLGNNQSTPQGLAKGDQLHGWLKANQQALGIDYILWREKDHWNHLHVNFAPSGYPAGGGPLDLPAVTSPGNWFGVPAGQMPSGGYRPAGQVATEILNNQRNTPPGVKPTAVPKPITPADITKGGSKPKTREQLLFPGMYNGGYVSKVMDRGGIIGPGTTVVHNYTGHPELVVPSFAAGGFNLGVPVLPRPPRPGDARRKVPEARAKAPTTAPPVTRQPPPPQMAPQVTPPPIVPQAPSVAPTPHVGTGTEPGPTQAPGPGGAPIGGPRAPVPAMPEEGMHLHPAARKGIASAAATIGSLADTAAAAASFGIGGAAGAIGGGMGGGAGGLSIGGLIQQGGKIVEDIANVGASFLVGNITGGTTANAYGVTQRGNIPSGGTKVVDASNNQYGDIYTNNLDEYFSRERRRENQRAQAGLGRWGNA